MDASYVLLSVVIALIAVGAKALTDVGRKSNNHSNRLVAVETKLDMLLEINGLDTNKVNKAIRENMDELKQNGKPSVHCINLKELYRDKDE